MATPKITSAARTSTRTLLLKVDRLDGAPVTSCDSLLCPCSTDNGVVKPFLYQIIGIVLCTIESLSTLKPVNKTVDANGNPLMAKSYSVV